MRTTTKHLTHINFSNNNLTKRFKGKEIVHQSEPFWRGRVCLKGTVWIENPPNQTTR
jgi:hypothetical protein